MRALHLIGPTMAFVALMSPKVLATPITFDGFQWQPLGQAQLSITTDGLQVTNIGSTGMNRSRDKVSQSRPLGAVSSYQTR